MNILFVVASKGFQDEEYFESKRIIEEAGHQVLTISDKTGTASGSEGAQIEISETLETINLDQYQGLVFIGGSGALKYLDNEHSYKLIERALQNNIIVGAICIAPLILARSGYFKGKKMTVWSSSMDRWPIDGLQSAEIEYLDQSVAREGMLITANGPSAAAEFSQMIVDLLDKI